MHVARDSVVAPTVVEYWPAWQETGRLEAEVTYWPAEQVVHPDAEVMPDSEPVEY